MKEFIKKYYISFLVGVAGNLATGVVYFASPSGPYYTSPISAFLEKVAFHASRQSTLIFDLLFFYIPLILVYLVVALVKRKSPPNIKNLFSFLLFSFIFFSFGTLIGELAFDLYLGILFQLSSPTVL